MLWLEVCKAINQSIHIISNYKHLSILGASFVEYIVREHFDSFDIPLDKLVATCASDIVEGMGSPYAVKILKTSLDAMLFSRYSPDVLRRVRVVADYLKETAEEVDDDDDYSGINKADITIIVDRLLANSMHNVAPVL